LCCPAGFVLPCLPTLARTVPDGPLWAHEIKHYGYRMICRRDGDRVRVLFGAEDAAEHSGPTVYWESEGFPGYVVVAIGNFADPHFPAPTIAVWEQSRHPLGLLAARDAAHALGAAGVTKGSRRSPERHANGFPRVPFRA
jgi:hypothetical protein